MICQNSQAKMKCHFVGRATSILWYSTSSFSSSRALSKSRADGVRPGEYSGSVIRRLSFNFSKSCLAFSVLREFPSWQMRKKSTRESAWKTWLKQKHQNFSSLNCSEPFWAVTQQHHKPISPEKNTPRQTMRQTAPGTQVPSLWNIWNAEGDTVLCTIVPASGIKPTVMTNTRCGEPKLPQTKRIICQVDMIRMIWWYELYQLFTPSHITKSKSICDHVLYYWSKILPYHTVPTYL